MVHPRSSSRPSLLHYPVPGNGWSAAETTTSSERLSSRSSWAPFEGATTARTPVFPRPRVHLMKAGGFRARIRPSLTRDSHHKPPPPRGTTVNRHIIANPPRDCNCKSSAGVGVLREVPSASVEIGEGRSKPFRQTGIWPLWQDLSSASRQTLTSRPQRARLTRERASGAALPLRMLKSTTRDRGPIGLRLCNNRLDRVEGYRVGPS